MKLLYMTLGAILVWCSPVMAEDSTDFGLDDKIITQEEVSEATPQNSEEVTDIVVSETISEEVPDFTEEEVVITESEETSVTPDETSSSANQEATPAEAEEATPSEDQEAPTETEETTPSENQEATPTETEEATPSEDQEAPTETEETTPSENQETTPAETEETTSSEASAQNESEAATEEENVAQEEAEEDTRTKEEFEAEISYYIKNMNLSVEQLDMAKYISNDSRLKIEQLLKSIYLLRSQARELENKSLNDFEAILTEEQREQFHKLRDTLEKEREKFEVLHIQPDEEPVGEDSISDAVSDSESGQENS